MKRIILINITALFLFAMYSGCDLADPTEVHNPAITEENLLADATGGAEPLITGLNFALADAVCRTAVYTENVSDDYVNTSTYLSTVFDDPRAITPDEFMLNDTREIYARIQVLHALADFGINTILPKDIKSTNSQKARAYFFRGLSVIMLCENFPAFPLVENGPALRSEEAIKIAIEDLKTSLKLDNTGDNAIQCNLALARAYRLAKDKVNAAAAANAALALNSKYTFYAQYDAQYMPNQVNVFTVVRGQNDMQPLPRLDFLDPKYPSPNSDDPISVLKSEEAYLVLAEVALLNGDLAGAKANMKDAINVVLTRPVLSYTDKDPRRNRPNADDFKVKIDNDAAQETGLIFKRSSSAVNTYPVSYTHLRSAEIDASASQSDLFRMLYLLRQEIFFSEGRRMSDLGIRLPVMQRQFETNPNMRAGDYGTYVVVPDYIPMGKQMDEFTFDNTTKTVTIKYDMNKVLSQNINRVSPFLK